MPLFQRSEVIEARQYDGPKLTVISDALGEQTANAGDWLFGSEPHKITVKTAAQFAAEGWKLVEEVPSE